MTDKVVSKRMAKKEAKYRVYKGKPAFKWDLFLRWFIKMLFQVLVFTVIYSFNIEYIRIEYDNNPLMIFLTIIGWMVITDIIVWVIVWAIMTFILYKTKFIPNSKRNNNAGLWLWEYLIYVSIRSICYLILLTSLLTMMYARVMPEFLAFFLAWVTVSLGAHLIAKASAIAITVR